MAGLSDKEMIEKLKEHEFSKEELNQAPFEAKKVVLACIAKFNEIISENQKTWEGDSAE